MKKIGCSLIKNASMASAEYDLAVIGGGSGGMAAAKEAASLGAKVVLFDFVKPSTQGSTWGLGGTCVNVGCVPKKLMHYGASIGLVLKHDAASFGWQLPGDVNHDWVSLRKTVQNHVKKLNFGYKNGLRSNKVEYINALAYFENSKTVTYTIKSEKKMITAKNFILATGGRPVIPENVKGALELGITSDDIFSLKDPPGKTLIIGASYIALETAGFLTGLGYDVTVAVRSLALRGFDRQCSEKVTELMADTGTKFLYGVVPESLTKVDNEIEVQMIDSNHKKSIDKFNTVVFATGRYSDTKKMNLEATGVKMLTTGKLECVNEQTNISNIYAVGDILEGKPELTPVAIKTGMLLARRLYGNSKETMDWDLVPTTIFTPFEYACVGLSEEDAIVKYQDVECYLFEFTNLELDAAHREKHPNRQSDEYDVDMPPSCLSKLV
eukprot:GHVL01041735.1.p1 GENE.GHVL01041735.1~~GHVL01041735.1.p1  ORF type:complete len:439 (+),score=91.03 GHVL01041735.1:15-1331(+)